jgi:hypothetical protein
LNKLGQAFSDSIEKLQQQKQHGSQKVNDLLQKRVELHRTDRLEYRHPKSNELTNNRVAQVQIKPLISVSIKFQPALHPLDMKKQSKIELN